MHIFLTPVRSGDGFLGSPISEGTQTWLFSFGDFILDPWPFFTFSAGDFQTVEKNANSVSSTGIAPARPGSPCPSVPRLSLGLTKPEVLPTHPRASRPAGPHRPGLPLPYFSVASAPSLLPWQVGRSEVSAFSLTSICKHLFMGSLLMHSILETAKSTTVL